MPADWTLELSSLHFDDPAHYRLIGTAKRAIAQLRGQRPVRHIVSGHDHQAAGSLIQPVHDARALLAAGSRPGSAPAEQGIHQGAGAVPGRRVHDHAGRLVDDQEVVVLEHDAQRYPLRDVPPIARLVRLELDHVPGRDPVGRPGASPIDRDPAVPDEPERRRTRQSARLLSEEPVEPGRRRRGRQAARGCARTKYPSAMRTTPTLTAESATLKTGQK